MDSIPPTADELLASARALRPLIEAEAPAIEQAGRITPPVVEALRKAGIYRMIVPRSLGGSELDLLSYSKVMEALAMADGSTAWCVGQNSGVCRTSGYMPRAGAEEVFGSPDAILSWGNGPATAHPVEGGYVVNCKLSFSSGMHHATWLGCQDLDVYDEHGNVVSIKRGETHRGICFFRPEDTTITEMWQVSGLRGTGSDSYAVTDLFVPKHRFAVDECQEPGPLYVLSSTNLFSVGFASVALGIARATLDALIEMTARKTPRGAGATMRDLTRVQAGLGVMEATYRSARALLHETIQTSWDEVCLTRQRTMEMRINLRMATTYAMQQAADVVDAAYKAAGVDAIFDKNAFERRFRDMHAVSQHIQARDDHFERVGQFLMGLDPDRGWL
jgi:alkylation response protein AidB-like acyl-CoA dehydrogenase